MPSRRQPRCPYLLALAAAAALLALLALAPGAQGAKYAVAQCGWQIGRDAEWDETSGGSKFRPAAYCIAPDGADPFEGTHMKNFTREAAGTVSGTRLARWRWTAPAGTGIVNVRGTWWHALRDGFEHRLGTGNGNGGFDVFAAEGTTNTALRDFAVGFAAPRRTFESRLLCARTEDRHCALDPASFSSVRALTLTLQDDLDPVPGAAGQLLAGGWQRGTRLLSWTGSDQGGGLRFAETEVDGARVALTEHACEKAMIGGEWRATRMRPCELARSGAHPVVTTRLSDGPHGVRHCAQDFAGNRACTASRTVLVDNTAPSAPRGIAVSGGDGWRRANSFAVTWRNPDQGAAAPVAGAAWRLLGRGHDSGVRFAHGSGIASLAGLSVPAAGEYTLRVWLRDEAANEREANAAEVRLRLDDAPPAVAFSAAGDPERPELVTALAHDAHSGVASGAIRLRRTGEEEWRELPTELAAVAAGEWRLRARIPSERLPRGSYELEAEAADVAGNRVQGRRRADGTPMVVRLPLKEPTRVLARLSGPSGSGRAISAPARAGARLSGVLRVAGGRGLPGRALEVVVSSRAGGRGLPGRALEVVVSSRAGALRRLRVEPLVTGADGHFALALPRGPSRILRVRFAGSDALEAARSAPLRLRVRAAATFALRPRRTATGRAIAMWGRVLHPGAVLPRRGKLVQVQYFEEAARRWRPVLLTRTDGGGRFRARYRFRYVSGVARIRLRAAVLPEARWPFALGASAARPVTVRG